MSKPKIALVCTGLGIEKRGFEAFTDSYFQALREQVPSLDVTLFQGRGKAEDRRVVIPNIPRYHPLTRWMDPRNAYILETRTFALCFYPLLLWGQYDIVHYNDLTMGSVLFHLRRYLRGNFKLLYCNGAPSPPVHYHHRCDFAQLLTGPMYEEARDFGMPPERLFLVPYGADARRFSPEKRTHRARIRTQFGIPQDAPVVLTAAALKRDHKRVDYVVRELATLREPVWLIAAGQRTEETPSLQKEAERLLPGRWLFLTCPHEEMPFLYGAADVFVLASLSEGFGLVTVEALLSGLPVVVHDHPTSRWILNGQSGSLSDLSREGTLAQELREIFSAQSPRQIQESPVKKFSWSSLIPEYLRMYQKVAQSPDPGGKS